MSRSTQVTEVHGEDKGGATSQKRHKLDVIANASELLSHETKCNNLYSLLRSSSMPVMSTHLNTSMVNADPFYNTSSHENMFRSVQVMPISLPSSEQFLLEMNKVRAQMVQQPPLETQNSLNLNQARSIQHIGASHLAPVLPLSSTYPTAESFQLPGVSPGLQMSYQQNQNLITHLKQLQAYQNRLIAIGNITQLGKATAPASVLPKQDDLTNTTRNKASEHVQNQQTDPQPILSSRRVRKNGNRRHASIQTIRQLGLSKEVSDDQISVSPPISPANSEKTELSPEEAMALEKGDRVNFTKDDTTTNAEVMKKKLATNTSSIYRGVCWNKCNSSWKASIKVKGVNKHLGYFDDMRDAALAYDFAAMRVRGDSAILNFRNHK